LTVTGKDCKRKIIKRRLKNAMTQSAQKYLSCIAHGDRAGADLARECWRILFLAEQDVDTFDFEGVTS